MPSRMVLHWCPGSGKSVELISVLAYAQKAGVDDIIIFDPKYEFAALDCGNASVYSEIEDLERVMAELVAEMNARIKSKSKKLTLVIFDEFADAMDQSHTSRELEGKKTLMENLKMLLQKGRSCGMRFCVATQRASTKVITGDIKVNIPVQVCFNVPKSVLSTSDAEWTASDTIAPEWATNPAANFRIVSTTLPRIVTTETRIALASPLF